MLFDWPEADPPLSENEREIMSALIAAIRVTTKCKAEEISGRVMLRTTLSLATSLACAHGETPQEGIRIVCDKLVDLAVHSALTAISEGNGENE